MPNIFTELKVPVTQKIFIHQILMLLILLTFGVNILTSLYVILSIRKNQMAIGPHKTVLMMSTKGQLKIP